MKPCPFCAEEIQDAAIRCKHCRSDLVEAAAPPEPSPRARRVRRVLAAAVALLALAAAGPVVARPVLRHLRASDGCQPTNWVEWHAAMRNQCLQAAYVCRNMTTPKLLEDPDVFRAFHGGASTDHLSELVGRMRTAYGCAPERGGGAFHPRPGPISPHAFPPGEDAPRSL